VLALGREVERDGVDAITQPGRRWAIVKDLALLRAATGAHDLRSHHSVAGVANLAQVFFGKWRGETWPAGAAFKLRAGFEQWQPAQAARIYPLAFLAEKDTAKRLFIAVIEHDTPLFRTEAVDQYTQTLFTGRCEIELQRSDAPHGFAPTKTLAEP